MKAVLCKAYGMPETLVVEEVEPLKAGKGQVVISVKGCGVNFMDTLIIQGKYQTRPPLPFSPGSEIAGIVKEVGEGVKSIQVGDRVLTMVGWGGFAEEVVVDASRVIPMPPELDFVTASAFVLAYGTSHHALKDRAQLQRGETLLALGASGGVGLSAVEIGHVMGARVIAAASSDEKLEVCKQYGADAVINYEREDLRERVRELTDGKGINVVYDPVGGKFSEPALRSLSWKGRFLVIGFASGDIPRIPLNLVMLKVISIVGVFWGAFNEREPQRSRENIQELLSWLVEGKIRPNVSATYSLERAPDALYDMMNRKVQGKVVVTP